MEEEARRFKFKVEISPHIVSPVSVSVMMRDVLIALLPAFAFSVYLWGSPVLKVYAVSVFFACFSEWLFLKIRKRKFENDFSAVVSGVLFAMVLPPKIPLVYVAAGISFGIVFGKQFFGGLGYNVFNPALLGRAFLMASFPVAMTSWISPLDATTTATPLGDWKFHHTIWETGKLFFGNIPGSIGETSALLLIIGGIYLIVRRTIDARIPLAYILTVFVLSAVYYFFDRSSGSPVFHIFAGGLMLGAFFMATDPVTAPANKKGRVLFGIGCGIFTLVIRHFGGYPEGVMFSILLMNAFAPLLERIGEPKAFGEV
ncbi:MAG: RnfABCDGE type electron transport complex subunit D [Elusimicrobia bacterium]|nr:RnfABCDGE type electron transport complex subunit D [Elusimicrobiota bacterium]